MQPLTGKLVVNIPKERIGVLIGPDGVTKRRIEREFNVKLTVNSETGEVTIEPRENCTITDILKARKVVEAIGLGFNPDIALKLRDDEYYLEVIDLKDYFKRREDLVRVKARLIGTEGRARRMIEELSSAHIVVGERYVAILGTYEQVRMARDAILRLISGAQHRTVYARLRRMRRELKRQKFWEEMLARAGVPTPVPELPTPPVETGEVATEVSTEEGETPTESEDTETKATETGEARGSEVVEEREEGSQGQE